MKREATEVREVSQGYVLSAAQPAAPVGFQHTELGIIPSDWLNLTVAHLIKEEIIERPLDGNHGNIHPKSGDFVYYGIPFVMANNVQYGKLDIESCSFIRKEQADLLQKGFSRPGDVLLTHKATIGNTAIVGEIPFDYIMLTPQVTYYRVVDKNRLNNVYLRHFFDSSSFQTVLKNMAGGGTRSYIGIKAQHRLPVVLPHIEEQRAISNSLSDVDALLEELDRLIAKTRDIKQATMQQLLTGQTRLRGYEGEWEVCKLGALANIKTGKRNNEDKQEDGEYPFFVRSQTVERIDTYSYNCEAILVPGEGNIGEIFHYINGPFDVHQRVYAITKFNHRVSASFVHAYMCHYFGAWAMQNTVKATVDSLRLPTFQNFALRLPPTKDEQEAVARTLDDIDESIGALEQRRRKTGALKQAMMQELLTGRTRLL